MKTPQFNRSRSVAAVLNHRPCCNQQPPWGRAREPAGSPAHSEGPLRALNRIGPLSPSQSPNGCSSHREQSTLPGVRAVAGRVTPDAAHEHATPSAVVLPHRPPAPA